MITPTMTTIAGAVDARDEVIRAALRFLSADRADPCDRHYDDELDYAADQLALAARQLVNATNKLHPDQQPVGWTS